MVGTMNTSSVRHPAGDPARCSTTPAVMFDFSLSWRSRWMRLARSSARVVVRRGHLAHLDGGDGLGQLDEEQAAARCGGVGAATGAVQATVPSANCLSRQPFSPPQKVFSK